MAHSLVIPVEAGGRLTKKLVSETAKEGPAGTGGPEAVVKLKAVATQDLPEGSFKTVREVNSLSSKSGP